MTKKILELKTVFSDEGLSIKGSKGLIDGVALRKTMVLPDERGRLGEIMRADDPWFEKFGQVYFTTTYPGVVKAWHFHEKQTDHFYVIKGLLKVPNPINSFDSFRWFISSSSINVFSSPDWVLSLW